MFICTTLDVSKSCTILSLCLMFQVVSGYRSYFSANFACCNILICSLCSTFRIVRVVNFLQDEEMLYIRLTCQTWMGTGKGVFPWLFGHSMGCTKLLFWLPGWCRQNIDIYEVWNNRWFFDATEKKPPYFAAFCVPPENKKSRFRLEIRILPSFAFL